MKQSKHRTAKLVRDYLIIFVIGAVLLYPIIWMFFASFKSNDEIFGSIRSQLQEQLRYNQHPAG